MGPRNEYLRCMIRYPCNNEKGLDNDVFEIAHFDAFLVIAVSRLEK